MDKEAFDNLQEGVKLNEKRAQQLNDINDIGRDYSGILVEQNRAAQAQLDLLNDTNKTSISQKNLTKANLDLAKSLAGLTKADLKDRKSREALQKKINKANDEARQLQVRLTQQLKEQADLRAQIEAAGDKAKEDDKIKLLAMEAQNEITRDQLDTLKMMSDEAKSFVKEVKKFKIGSGFHFLADLVKDIPIIRDIFSNLTAGADKFDETLAATGSTLEALNEGFKEMAKLSLKALAAFTVSSAIDGFKLLDRGITGLQRNLMTTGKNASIAFNNIEVAVGRTGMTLDKVLPLSEALNDTLGTQAVFSADTFAEMSVAVNKYGIAAGEAAKLYKEAAVSGKTLGTFLDSAFDSVTAFNKTNKSAISVRAVLEDVAGASAATSLSLKNFPGGIVAAATQARKLGLTLDKVQNTMSGMLDIENSLAAEMEAEILLGRDLNLDKARLAALNNDAKTAAEEIAKAAGGAAEFGKLNRLQQEALADAVSMSVDDLAGMLKSQEAQTSAAEEAAKQGQEQIDSGKELKKQLDGSQTTSEALAAAFEQIKLALGEIVIKYKDDIISMINSFKGFLDKLKEGDGGALTTLKTGLGAIAAISFLGPIGSLKLLVKGIRGFINLITGQTAVNATKNLSNLTQSKIPTPGSPGSPGGGGGPGASAPKYDPKTKRFRGPDGKFVKAPSGAPGGVPGGGGKIQSFLKNPGKALKNYGKQILGKFGPVAKRVPLIGTLIEGYFARKDIKALAESGMDPQDIYKDIGKRTIEGVTGVIGGAAASTLVNALSVTGIPGFLLSGLAYMGGDFVGRKLGGMLADLGPSMSGVIGKSIASTFGFDDEIKAGAPSGEGEPVMQDFISRPGMGVQKFRKDDIIIGGTKLTSGGDSSRVEALLERLITAVESGGDVYIDGNKAGNALVLASSRFN